MKGWYMYSKIKQLKEDGLNMSQASKKLNINYKTVRKYWNMTYEEYENYNKKTKTRRKKLDKYKDDILAFLYKHNDYKTSQILDRLKEKYPDKSSEFKYSTLRRYIKVLRKKHNIPKVTNKRQYQAFMDPPMGYQAQVDLGYITLKNPVGEEVKLCAMAMVLSNSRYKYIEWLDYSPETKDLLKFHENAFQYFKGMPEEIVYDQDRLVVVNENFGDIIYTAEFEAYRQQKKFKTYVCRSRDPETKGRVEAVVKYVKDNFAKYRVFTDIKEFNQLCLAWLKRTGNEKVHGTTKKVPAEVFKKEQKHLRMVPDIGVPKSLKNIISRKVTKDNTIRYNANRYTVPLGTYKPGKEVGIEIIDEKIIKIIDIKTGEIITEHEICHQRGKLIQNRNHLRDHSKKIKKLYDNAVNILGDNDPVKTFLKEVKKDKSRYIRDQYSVILKTAKKHSKNDTLKTINYCVENELWSASSFVSVINNVDTIDDICSKKDIRKKDNYKEIDNIYKIETQVRNLSEYENLTR
ncbi:MAG: IS21 family transposase [Thermotogota bacterium]